MYLCSLVKIWPLVQKIEWRQGYFIVLSDPGDLENYSKVTKIKSFLLAVPNKYLCKSVKFHSTVHKLECRQKATLMPTGSMPKTIFPPTLPSKSLLYLTELTLCFLGFFLAILLSADFFRINLFEKFFHYRVSNSLDPGQARLSVWPDLDPNCLLRLSADWEAKS